jgi:hypothetical protein
MFFETRKETASLKVDQPFASAPASTQATSESAVCCSLPKRGRKGATEEEDQCFT